jgi:hypothetical protein
MNYIEMSSSNPELGTSTEKETGFMSGVTFGPKKVTYQVINKALCRRTYGFQRLFNSSLISGLCSGRTLGDSKSFGNISVLYLS